MVHRLRGNVDALLTGIGRVKADNPLLTCRTSENRDPVRVVIDPELEVNLKAHVLSIPPDTIIVTKKKDLQGSRRLAGNEEKKRLLVKRGVQVIEYKGDKVDLAWLLRRLGERSITSLLIEGGSSLNSYCLEHGIVDKVIFFIAPKIIGGRDSFPAVGGREFRDLQNAHQIRDVRIKRIGDDILLEGYIRK